MGELLNLLRILKSKSSVTPNDGRINLHAFNVVRSAFLQKVDVVAISNGPQMSLILTTNHCASCWDILDQKIKSVLIDERLDGVAEHLRIFGMQSDLVIANKSDHEFIHSIAVQGNAFLS